MRELRPEILTLAASHFYEVCCELRKQGSYTNPQKTQFRDELAEIGNGVMRWDFSKCTPPIFEAHHVYVKNILMPWAIALDQRNAYTLSSEMRKMMDNLCSMWIGDSSNYAFSADDGAFACARYSSDWGVLMSNFEFLYGIKPSCQLVMLKVPKHLHEDFLFIGSLYHEMGHFVDAYYNIWDRVYQKTLARLKTPAEYARIRGELFPIIEQTYEGDVCKDENRRNKFLTAQIKEYIADLFATQYLGCHRGNHVEYISAGFYDKPDDEHPSPECRWAIEEAFMNDDRTNFLYADISDEFVATGHPLTLKMVKPTDYAALDKGEPMTVQNEEELHSVLWYGWEVYLRGPQAMAKAQGPSGVELSQYDFYQKLNSALKQTIGNYLK